MNLNVLNEEGGYSLTRADRFSHEGAAVTEGLVPAELTEAGKTAGILHTKKADGRKLLLRSGPMYKLSLPIISQ